ncbi:U4/U6 small nuclear ribonucleoprotein Prp4 [Pycnococcus provasolii]
MAAAPSTALALSADANRALEEQASRERAAAMRARLSSTAVPAADADVRVALRSIGEPITLFGEGPAERRNRLRALVAEGAELTATVATEDTMAVEPAEDDEAGEEVDVGRETFYTEGTETLKRARIDLCEDSIARAAKRLANERELTRESVQSAREEVASRCAALAMEASELADARPVAACSLRETPAGDAMLATASWGGSLKLWRLSDNKCLGSTEVCEDRLTGVDLHPSATVRGEDTPSTEGIVATSAADGVARLHKCEDGSLLRELPGHTGRIGRLKFNPCNGRWLATAGFDATWRLWDCDTGEELLLQEGHSRSVYTVAWHGDGALLCSAGFDCSPRLWDVRSGRCLAALHGHSQKVLGADFSPNGYHLATAGADNTCRLWDIRRLAAPVPMGEPTPSAAQLYTIPAHMTLVSACLFEPSSGSALATFAFDGCAKLWSTRTLRPLANLQGHASRVSDGAVGAGMRVLVTASHDRTFKVWR